MVDVGASILHLTDRLIAVLQGVNVLPTLKLIGLDEIGIGFRCSFPIEIS